MKLNIVTGRTGKNAQMPVEVDEKVIWSLVLNAWRMRYPLTDKIVDVFSTVLSLEQNTSYFSGEGSKLLRSIVSNTSSAELSRIRSQLIDAKLLTEGTGRGEAYPATWLLNAKNRMQIDKKLEIIIVFDVKE